MANEILTFGRFIALQRCMLGISQKGLSAQILRENGKSISSPYLHDIERDRRTPSSDHIVRQFAVALHVDVDYLHYLNGRFPEAERQERCTEQQFRHRMRAFRQALEGKMGR